MASRLTDALDNNEMLSEVTVDYVTGVNIDYDEPAGHGHLNILNDVTALEQSQQIKDYYGADMIAILVSDREYCGLAPVRATPSTNLFTVMRECVDYTFAHEFGHQMGALHNPEEDNSGTFNHGYLDVENGFRTIMAYDSPDNCCSRIPYFSTPTQYNSNGNPLGTSSTHDNERQLREYAPTAAALNDKNTKNIDAPVLQAFWDACLGLNDILWTQEWGNGPVTYKVYRSAYSSMNNKMLHATTSGTYSSVTLNYPGDSPYIAVQACDLDGCSGLSNVRKASYQNVCL